MTITNKNKTHNPNNSTSFLKEMLLKKSYAHFFIIAAVALISYSNTFGVPFLFDDLPNIVESFPVKNLDFSQNRIVGLFTFVLNYKVHGLEATGYHAVNLIIHILNALLVYVLVLLTFRSSDLDDARLFENTKTIALFAGLFFVSHPLQTQAVTYIVQRFASLATFFYLLSLVLYIRCRLVNHFGPKHIALYFLSLISAVLAMKTKEIAFTLPLVIALYELIFFKDLFKRRFCYLIPFLLTMLIIPLTILDTGKLLGKAAQLNTDISIEDSTKLDAGKPLWDIIDNIDGATRVDARLSRKDYLMTQFRVIVTYIRLLFFPFNQNLDYDYPVYHSFINPQVFLSFLFLLMIFSLGVFLLYRSMKLPAAGTISYKMIAFGVLWFFITLSVESSIIPIFDVIFEHRVYLPSVGVAIAITVAIFLLLDKLSEKKQRAGIIILSAMIILLSFSTYSRNNVWRSEITLWQDGIEKSPEKDRPYINLGMALGKIGKYDEAIKYLLQALQIKPDEYRAHYNLGLALYNQGKHGEAIRHYYKALQTKPNHFKAHYNLGLALADQGKYDEAAKHYYKALQIKPNHYQAYYNLGLNLAAQGKYDEAIKHFAAAIRINPNYADAYNNLGNALIMKGKVDEAITYYRKVLRIQPSHAFARSNLMDALAKQNNQKTAAKIPETPNIVPKNPTFHIKQGDLYKAKGNIGKAQSQYKKALSINPEYTPALNNLALLYVEKGEYDRARLLYEKIINLQPDSYVAYYNVACLYARQNKIDDSIDWLKKAVQKGFKDWKHLKIDKDLENIRGSSYFKELTAPIQNKDK